MILKYILLVVKIHKLAPKHYSTMPSKENSNWISSVRKGRLWNFYIPFIYTRHGITLHDWYVGRNHTNWPKMNKNDLGGFSLWETWMNRWRLGKWYQCEAKLKKFKNIAKTILSYFCRHHCERGWSSFVGEDRQLLNSWHHIFWM